MDEMIRIRGTHGDASRGFAILVAFLMAMVAALIIAFGTNVAAVDDDMGIALALSGLYPESGLSLFVNAALSRIVLLISTAFPGINAFFAVEYCLTILAIAVFSYAAIAFLDDRVVAFWVIGLLSLLLLGGCTYAKNFTLVATLLTISGFFALIVQIGSRKYSVALCILAILLCLGGFMVRWECFQLALPFAAVALLHRLWMHARIKAQHQMGSRISLQVVPLAITAALVAGALVYDGVQWDSPGWSEWKTYNHVRSLVSDYPMPEYAAIATQLAEGGVSEIDYRFATTWRTADNDFFTTETLGFIASLSEGGSALDVNETISDLQTWAQGHVVAVAAAAIFILLYAIRARRLTATANVAVLLAISAFACIALYFSNGGRFPERVLLALAADAVACIALVIGDGYTVKRPWRSAKPNKALRGIAVAVSTMLCVASVGFVAYKAAPDFESGPFDRAAADPTLKPGIARYIHEHRDLLFVVDTGTMAEYLSEYGMRAFPPQKDLMRVLLLGGWSLGSPYAEARNGALGMRNTIKGLVENENARYLLIGDYRSAASEMESYLEAHYYDEVTYELADSFKMGEASVSIVKFNATTPSRAPTASAPSSEALSESSRASTSGA